MENLLLFSVTIACLLLAVASTLFRSQKARSRAKSRGCLAPRRYHHRDPIFGLDVFLTTAKSIAQNRYLDELELRYAKYGHTFETLHFGSTSINSIHPKNLQAVWVTNVHDWGVQPLRLPNMLPFCGRGFITTDGAEWGRARALLKPSFHRSHISDLSVVEQGLNRLLEDIPKDGSTVNLQGLLFKLYLDMNINFLFGESIGVLPEKASRHAEDLIDAFQSGFEGSGMRIALGPFKYLLPKGKWLKACHETHKFVDWYIDKGIENRRLNQEKGTANSVRPARQTLLETLLEQTTDREDIRNQLIQALMAAQETTAVLISNIFFLLARHPTVWDRLRAEVLSVEDKPLDFNQLGKMRYLHHVINEALRLFPVFPQMNRVALRDTVLPIGGGPDGQSPIFITAGTGFDTAWSVVHRSPEVWGSDAGEFKPERWETLKPGAFDYMPFGAGTRMCVGQQKATTETCYIVSRILQKFQRIESRDDREWKGQVQLTAKNVHGCHVALH